MKSIFFTIAFFVSFLAMGQSFNRLDAIRLIKEGDNFMRMGNWEYALSRYNDAVITDPEYADALMKRAALYEQTGRQREAAIDYQRAISLNPYSVHIYDQRIRKEMIASDYLNPMDKEDKTNEEIERLIDDCIQWDAYSTALANIDTLLSRGFEPILEMEKKALIYFLTGELDSSQAVIRDIENMTDASYMAADISGLIQLKRGNTNGAIAHFNRAISIDPTFPVFYFNRSMAHRMNGNTNEALKDLNASIKKSKENAEAYVLRALIKKESGDLNGALQDYSSAIAVNPNNSKALHNRGYVLKLMGDYTSALNDATALVKLDPNTPEHWNLKGNLHFLYNEFEEAIQAFTNAIAMHPEYAEAYYNRGLAQLMNYMLAQGCADLRESEALGYDGADEVYSNYCEK